MQVATGVWDADGFDPKLILPRADLVLAFGSGAAFEDHEPWAELRRMFPGAKLAGCSTAGEIIGTRVHDNRFVATAIAFDAARALVRETPVSLAHSESAGGILAGLLPHEGLRHVLVLSDGQNVNGSALVRGLRGSLPRGVAATGGLAGDGDRFKRTLVAADGDPREDRAVAIGLYGPVRAGYGSLGGWDSFGPRRVVTRAHANVVYELDGRPALDLYKQYLGDDAAGLPASGLMFPLSVAIPGEPRELVRTILAVDERERSLTFAGELPEGAVARLMHANFERLVDGAEGAARGSMTGGDAELALLVSCVGRKLVLRQRTEEELEAVRHVLGPRPNMTGFYSYGEICPSAPNAGCDLHNQTMTITTLRETHAPAA